MKFIYIALIVLCIALVLVSPVVTIWALNALFVGVVFKSAIELTIWTYLAMIWLTGILIGIVKALGNAE